MKNFALISSVLILADPWNSPLSSFALRLCGAQDEAKVLSTIAHWNWKVELQCGEEKGPRFLDTQEQRA
ncbi:hypothetical protein KP509_02G048800 [Ceratopteris richardii]|uniref:Uncharacterized protein n=1 Tax=Ceratopteris richardii TaxID=49495 RepID=A0A8T2V5L2_CERRI|nr:hypothetical protein KP509_02G048800 [Ceratopteris richardii]